MSCPTPRPRQAALKKQVAEQKARVAALNDLQAGLAAEITDTKHQLRAIGADLTAVKKKIVKMEARIELVKDGLRRPRRAGQAHGRRAHAA